MSDLSPEIRAFLDEPRFGVVATLDADGSVHQSVVWYALRDNAILFNTRRGRRKDRNLRRDPHISFCVEDGYRWVAIQGTVEIIDDPAVAQPDILEITRRYVPPGDAERQHEEVFSREQRVSMLLPVDRITVYGFDERS